MKIIDAINNIENFIKEFEKFNLKEDVSSTITQLQALVKELISISNGNIDSIIEKKLNEKTMRLLREELEKCFSGKNSDKSIADKISFGDLAYNSSIFLAELQPLNDQNLLLIDLQDVPEKDIVYTSRGRWYTKDEILQLVTNSSDPVLIDPFDRRPLPARDIKHIQSIALQHNIKAIEKTQQMLLQEQEQATLDNLVSFVTNENEETYAPSTNIVISGQNYYPDNSLSISFNSFDEHPNYYVESFNLPEEYTTYNENNAANSLSVNDHHPSLESSWDLDLSLVSFLGRSLETGYINNHPSIITRIKTRDSIDSQYSYRCISFEVKSSDFVPLIKNVLQQHEVYMHILTLRTHIQSGHIEFSLNNNCFSESSMSDQIFESYLDKILTAIEAVEGKMDSHLRDEIKNTAVICSLETEQLINSGTYGVSDSNNNNSNNILSNENNNSTSGSPRIRSNSFSTDLLIASNSFDEQPLLRRSNSFSTTASTLFWQHPSQEKKSSWYLLSSDRTSTRAFLSCYNNNRSDSYVSNFKLWLKEDNIYIGFGVSTNEMNVTQKESQIEHILKICKLDSIVKRHFHLSPRSNEISFYQVNVPLCEGAEYFDKILTVIEKLEGVMDSEFRKVVLDRFTSACNEHQVINYGFS